MEITENTAMTESIKANQIKKLNEDREIYGFTMIGHLMGKLDGSRNASLFYD